jgi:hypothetical protein
MKYRRKTKNNIKHKASDNIELHDKKFNVNEISTEIFV